MSTLVQRRVGGGENSNKEGVDVSSANEPKTQQAKSGDVGSEEEMEPLPSMPSGDDTLPQDKADVEVLNSALKDLTPRWKNWVIRGIFTWVMILIFGFIVHMGKRASFFFVCLFVYFLLSFISIFILIILSCYWF